MWRLKVHDVCPFEAGNIEGCLCLLLLERLHVLKNIGDVFQVLNVAQPAYRDLLYLPELLWRVILFYF